MNSAYFASLDRTCSSIRICRVSFFGGFGSDFRIAKLVSPFPHAGFSKACMKPCLLRLFTVEKRPTRNASRAGATPRTFWAAGSQKSRVAPARFSLFSTVTFAGIAFRISFVLNKLAAPQGDESGEGEGGGCNPYFLH